MSLISSSIPNFVNGISQQPFTLRLNSQGEYQENALSTVSQGLKKRPPTQHLAKIQSTPLTDAYIHTINRDVTERYVVVVTNGDLKVYDLAGNQKTVNFPSGKAYLNVGSGTVANAFSAVTVADYTFLVNKTKTVTESSSTVPSRPHEALISVKAGNYGKTYKILINGSAVASFTTPDGSVSSHVTQISTDYIASQLYAAYTPGSGYSKAIYGSTIYIYNSSTDFTIAAEDGFNNGAMVAIKDKLSRFSDLPANPRVDGFVVEITGTGDSSSLFDAYFVRFDAAGSNGVGVWRESPKPGITLGVVNTSMPHTLVRETDGTFTFDYEVWNQRICGSTVTNEHPSFVGRTINNILFYRNRLGFLVDESISLSESGNYFNFYRTSVTSLLDQDPIDVTASNMKVSYLKQALPFNKQLLLFSDQAQFVIDTDTLLTPRTVSLKLATEFPCNTNAAPVGIGRNVYFAVDKGSYSAVKEYFTDNLSINNDATDITGHIPKYIPSSIFKLTAAANEDIMVALSANDPTKLFVYKYFFANAEKLQSAWSAWSFGSDTTILNADFLQSELFMVVSRSDGVYLEKMNVSLGDVGVGEPYLVHLDRKVQIASSALTYVSGYTLINTTTLGYLPTTGSYKAVVRSHPTAKAGEIYDVIWDGTNAKILGNLTSGTLTVGRTFNTSYTLSTITVKQTQQGGGQKSDTEGRLQLRKVAFNYSDTGYFDVLVTPSGRTTYTYTYSGKVLGQESASIGRYSISGGRFVVPVVSRNIGTTITLQNNSPLPCSFLSADWEGYYVKRSQQV